MAEDTKIQWCSHTFNPWRGCQKVNAGCVNCYAERDRSVKMHGIGWGTEAQGGTRVRLSDAGWKKPRAWDRKAKADREAWSEDCAERYSLTWHGRPERPRVFCASLADVFEDWNGPILDHSGSRLYRTKQQGKYIPSEDTLRFHQLQNPCTLDDLRADLFRLIDQTPNLDWLILSKRPENIRSMWQPPEWHDCLTGECWHRDQAHCNDALKDPAKIGRDNVWLGTSASDQETADKAIPELLKCRDLAAKLFLSLEPLVGPVDLSRWFYVDDYMGDCDVPGGMMRIATPRCEVGLPVPDLVIVGGESGPNARPCNVAWIRSIVNQCQAAAVPVFVKQLGSDVFAEANTCSMADYRAITGMTDPKGGEMSEWPEDLRVREMTA